MTLFTKPPAPRRVPEPWGQGVSPPAVPTEPPPRQYSLPGQVAGRFTFEGSMYQPGETTLQLVEAVAFTPPTLVNPLVPHDVAGPVD